MNETNKIIAEFMGCYLVYDDPINYPEGYWHNDSSERNYPTNIEDFEFHNNWNWLMEVVEEIESLGYITRITHRKSDVGFFHEMVVTNNSIIVAETLEKLTWINNAENYSKMEAVYEACINFINWYNKNKDSL